MHDLSEWFVPVSVALAVTFAASILIVLTRHWHAAGLDIRSGPQHVHDTVTPRTGGAAVFLGFWAGTIAAPVPVHDILLALGAGGSLVFLFGLAEDLTHRVAAVVRLIAALFSGLLFCILTGHSVGKVDIGLVDPFLDIRFVSVAFTLVAMASLINAINLIDGLNGLAAGSVLIMLLAFAVVAGTAGDHELVLLVSVIMAALLGFLLVNFPRGYIFLGDGGAYFAGLLLGAVAVMLPARNPEVSPWISVVVLAYPVLEMLYVVIRRARSGPLDGLMKPDRGHLHTRLRDLLVNRSGSNIRLVNPLTGAIMLGGSLSGLILVLVLPGSRDWLISAFVLQALLYALATWTVEMLHRRRAARDGGP